MDMRRKRLAKELKDIRGNAPEGCSNIECKEFNKWEVCMKGPQDSPYEGGTFKLLICFPDRYPFQPPTVTFLTPIFHPNIGDRGLVCLNILQQDEWTPSLTASNVLTSVRCLLTIPNADHPMNTEAASMIIDNRNNFDRKAREWTNRFAR